MSDLPKLKMAADVIKCIMFQLVMLFYIEQLIFDGVRSAYNCHERIINNNDIHEAFRSRTWHKDLSQKHSQHQLKAPSLFNYCLYC